MKKEKTILVIEDENELRKALIDVLELKNFSVLSAKNGKEGLEIARSKHPDLILLDLLMPEIDGMTVLKHIREDIWGKDVPVIILTNMNATDEKLVEAMILHKPLSYLIKSDWKIYNVVKEIEKIFA